MASYIRTDQADARVSLDRKPLFGSWATATGGGLAAPGSKTRPGGMGDEVETGSSASRADATCTIQWDENVLARFKHLESRIGVGRVRISKTFLDREGRKIPGSTITRVGILKSASEPDYDHNGNVVGFLTIVVGLDERTA